MSNTESHRSNLQQLTRRNFSGLALAGATTLAVAQPARSAAQPAEKSGGPIIKRGAVVLFQGDSITDAKRDRQITGKPNNPAALGTGYAWLVAAQLLVDRPDDDLKVINRGNSGNKVFQLVDRWQADCLVLNPDVLSILIGVNDFWHTLDGTYDGTIEKYEADYRALLKRTKEALPNVALVICEPFVLLTGRVNQKWIPEIEKYRAAARRLAEEFQAKFVAYQAMFDRASKIAPPERWAADGVHPTPDGAALMAGEWLKAVRG